VTTRRSDCRVLLCWLRASFLDLKTLLEAIMHPRILWTLITPITCLLFPSCVSVISHDQDAAAEAATRFAERAFVRRDFSSAHILLSFAAQRRLSAEDFAAEVAKIHRRSFPSAVEATDFEPVPGQRAIYIYVRGTGGGEDFFYRIVMEGDAPSGYRVNGFFRGNGPHPSQNKRRLEPNPGGQTR
jgi:hypothetical protein